MAQWNGKTRQSFGEGIIRSCNNEDHNDYDEMALITGNERLHQSFGEESGLGCNNEEYDDYDEMALMTTEMEWDYVNRSVKSGRICNNEDHDDWRDGTDHYGNGKTASIVRWRNQTEDAIMKTTMAMTRLHWWLWKWKYYVNRRKLALKCLCQGGSCMCFRDRLSCT